MLKLVVVQMQKCVEIGCCSNADMRGRCCGRDETLSNGWLNADMNAEVGCCSNAEVCGNWFDVSGDETLVVVVVVAKC